MKVPHRPDEQLLLFPLQARAADAGEGAADVLVQFPGVGGHRFARFRRAAAHQPVKARVQHLRQGDQKPRPLGRHPLLLIPADGRFADPEAFRQRLGRQPQLPAALVDPLADLPPDDAFLIFHTTTLSPSKDLPGVPGGN